MGLCDTLKSERLEGGRCFSTGSDFSGDKCRNAIDECKKEIVNEAVSLKESCANGKGLGKALFDACRSGGSIDYGKCKKTVDECKKMKSEIVSEAVLVQESCPNGKLYLKLVDACRSGGLIDYGRCKKAVDDCKLKITEDAEVATDEINNDGSSTADNGNDGSLDDADASSESEKLKVDEIDTLVFEEKEKDKKDLDKLIGTESSNKEITELQKI